MSVIAETSQSAMGPYVTMAVCWLVVYSWAAVLRSAVFVKKVSTRRRRWVGGQGVPASITGSHCGGHATACSTTVSLLATLGFVTCGMEATTKPPAATPTRTSARKREACSFAYRRMACS